MTYWKYNSRKVFAVPQADMLQISPEKVNMKIHYKKISPSWVNEVLRKRVYVSVCGIFNRHNSVVK